MPTTLPAAVDPVALARSRGRVSGAVPLAELGRVAEVDSGEAAGEARVELGFELDADGRAVVTGRVEATIELICQRCLQPFALALRSDVALVVSDGDDALPAGFEPVEVERGKVDVRGLVEDELLLALPPVARHPPGDCEPPARTDESADAQTIRPFANLRGLIDGGRGK